MGFYNLETLKEDARRHGIKVINPHLKKSDSKCVIEEHALRLGFLNVASVGSVAARAIVEAREHDGPFTSVADFIERTGLLQGALENLGDAVVSGGDGISSRGYDECGDVTSSSNFCYGRSSKGGKLWIMICQKTLAFSQQPTH